MMPTVALTFFEPSLVVTWSLLQGARPQEIGYCEYQRPGGGQGVSPTRAQQYAGGKAVCFGSARACTYYAY